LLLTLLSAATAATAAPSGAPTTAQKLPGLCDAVTVLVSATCTAAETMTATVKLWAYYPEAAAWDVFKSRNAGNAIAETSDDAINYAETVTGLDGATAIQVQLTAVAGAGAAVTAKAVALLRRR
jgi:hypothetical protein